MAIQLLLGEAGREFADAVEGLKKAIMKHPGRWVEKLSTLIEKQRKWDTMKLGKEEFAAECRRRRDAGLTLKHGGSYDTREQIKALGAIWDGQEKGWLMPDAASYSRAYQLAEEQYPGGGKSAPEPPTQQTPQTPANTEDIPF